MMILLLRLILLLLLNTTIVSIAEFVMLLWPILIALLTNAQTTLSKCMKQ